MPAPQQPKADAPRINVDMSELISIRTAAGTYLFENYEQVTFSAGQAPPKEKPTNPLDAAIRLVMGRPSWILVERETRRVTVVPERDILEYYFSPAR